MEKRLNPTYRKFQVLDVLRLWAAIEIALLHAKFSGFYHANAYVFADFFFILSGFILSESHFSKPRLNAWTFIKSRFIRLYPLHFIAMMALLLHFTFIRRSLPEYGDGTVYTFFTTLFLVHGLGLRKITDGDWNFPTWALSAEFWSNIFFVVFMLRFKKTVIALISIGAYLSVYHFDKTLDTYFHNYFGLISSGLVRATGGLCLGIVLHKFMKNRNGGSIWIWSFVEIGIFSAVFFLLKIADDKPYKSIEFFLIPVFGIMIGIFSHQRGILSKILIKTKLQVLGVISYAIFIFHWPLVLFIHEVLAPSEHQKIYIFIPILLVFGSLIYWFIEKPLVESWNKQRIFNPK